MKDINARRKRARINYILKRLVWKTWRVVSAPVLDRTKFYDTGTFRVYYKRSLDGGGSALATDFLRIITMSNLEGLAKGHVLEWCAGPGFIGFAVLSRFRSASLTLQDINPQTVPFAQRTIKENDLKNVFTYTGDSVSLLPRQHFDLVVANPPHFASKDEFFSYGFSDRMAIDSNWEAHRNFFNSIQHFLKPESRVVLIENQSGSTSDDFVELLTESNLEVKLSVDDLGFRHKLHTFYYVILGLRGHRF